MISCVEARMRDKNLQRKDELSEFPLLQTFYNIAFMVDSLTDKRGQFGVDV